MFDDSARCAGAINHVEMDADRHDLHAAAFSKGIWRSTTAAPPGSRSSRPRIRPTSGRTEFALNTGPPAQPAIYVGDGGRDRRRTAPTRCLPRRRDQHEASAATLTNGTTNPGFIC